MVEVKRDLFLFLIWQYSIFDVMNSSRLNKQKSGRNVGPVINIKI